MTNCPFTRYAIVRNARTRQEAEAYLPSNYRIVWEGQVPRYEGANNDVPGFVIEGCDEYGWTLDGYIQPRYASGLIGCQEIDLSHPIMKRVPA
jgi:hypothetical protein